MNSVRIDKYLWSIRLFKTRSKAAEACKSNKILINNQEVKPAKEVRIDDIVIIKEQVMMKTIRVTGLIHQRVSAVLAAENYEDLTAPSEYDKVKKMHEVNHEWRERGLGRPTKKDRRKIEWLKKKD